jgi:hypothetical protein
MPRRESWELLMKRSDWVVLPLANHSDAVAMVEKWHYSASAPNTSTYRHGLYMAADLPLVGDPFGCALWIPPTPNAAATVAGDNWRGVLSLSRFVISPDAPKNAASFLLGASMRMIDRSKWHTLLTYADTAHGHTGTIYKATNWHELGPVPAGDCWIDSEGRQRGRKRGGKTLTVQQMRDAGLTKLPSLPKIKFVHYANRGSC